MNIRNVKVWLFIPAIILTTSITSIFIFQKEEQKYAALLEPLDCPGCNVVVILVDTLRADHLPTYGYKRNTAPFLDALFKKSTVFERAFSSSSWTAPATASVFTSLYPSEHGVISGFLATQKMIKQNIPIHMNKIPIEYRTLGEMMQRAGYQTLGVADNLNIGTEMGFDRGFEQFQKFGEKGVEKVNKVASSFINKVKQAGPYFAYLHYMDPHAPYLKLDPFYSKCVKGTNQSEEQKSICAYDSEIFNLDTNLKKMFVKYKWMDNSIVIFLSDHGEELWDRGDRGHGKTLYTELIHVPFAIYHPKWPGKRISHNVHTMDLMPTLAGILGRNIKREWRGVNLLPVLEGNSPDPKRMLFSERLRTPHSKNDWWKRSVIHENMHFILTESKKEKIKEELFNLEIDFQERNDLSKTNETLAMNFNKKFSHLPAAKLSLESSNSGQVKVDVDTELLERLKTLGYLD